MALMMSAISCTQGKQEIVMQDVTVSPFHEIELRGVANIALSQGDKESVRLEADKELLPDVKITNEGDKLVVNTEIKHRWFRKSKITVYITVKNLTRLTSNGVGNITYEKPLTVEKLQLHISEVGNVTLSLTGNELQVTSAGVGNITLTGAVQRFSVASSGAGNVNAVDLKADTVSVTNQGVGNMSVYAAKELSITNQGVGNVRYKGGAVIKQVTNQGVGNIKPL